MALVNPKVGDCVILNQDYTSKYRKGRVCVISRIITGLSDCVRVNKDDASINTYRLDPVILTDLEKILYDVTNLEETK